MLRPEDWREYDHDASSRRLFMKTGDHGELRVVAAATALLIAALLIVVALIEGIGP